MRISEVLLLVEQVGPRATQVDDLRAAVPVFLEAGAFEAVEGVGDSLEAKHISYYPRHLVVSGAEAYLATAYDTLVLIVPKGALIADARKSRRADVAVADGALAITLVAETADGDASLFAAHDEISGSCSSVLRTPRMYAGRLTDDGETWLRRIRDM